MNYFEQILLLLTEGEEFGELLLAPNAPPVMRSGEGMKVALNQVLSADDIAQTLQALRSRGPQSDRRGNGAEAFSFGIPDRGRFRVNYVSQRGSKVVSIRRIPYAVPALETLCEAAEDAEKLVELMKGREGAVLPIFGRDALTISTLAYVLLKLVNQSERRLICILERRLTFLMGHDNSIVVQTEVGVDVPTLQEGLDQALLLRPDIAYIGGLHKDEELPGMLEAAESGTCVMVGGIGNDRQVVLQRMKRQFSDAAGSLANLVKQTVEAEPKDGKILLKLRGGLQEN